MGIPDPLPSPADEEKRQDPLSSRRTECSTLALPPSNGPHDERVPVCREYAGIDLHRRHSVIVRKNSDGGAVEGTHRQNDLSTPGRGGLRRRPRRRRVVVEAVFGGTGRRMSSRSWAPTSTWPIPSATTWATGH
jgi:hypothetical protein